MEPWWKIEVWEFVISNFNVTAQFMMMDNLLDYIQIAKGYSISVS